ncbi:MAG: hypothetical protein ACLUIQ_02355 [Dialister invisus]
MNIIKTLDQLPEKRPVVLAFGFFDGVHRGHQAVLQACLQLAREKSDACGCHFLPPPIDCIITFCFYTASSIRKRERGIV